MRVWTYDSRGGDILGKHDTLGLNDEEVDQLVHISYHAIERLSRNHVVLARAELGSEAVLNHQLPNDLGGNGAGQHHPGQLEAPSDDVEVPGGEDEGHDGGIGDGRGAWDVRALVRWGAYGKGRRRGGG